MQIIKKIDEQYLNQIIKKTYLFMKLSIPTKTNFIKKQDRKIKKKLLNFQYRNITGTNFSNVQHLRYFKELGLSYNVIPKNGHTNIMIILNDILKSNEKNIMAIRRYGRLKEDIFRIDIHYFIFNSYKFTFVRNPYIRALSMYRYMFENKYNSQIGLQNGFTEFLKFLKYGGINLNEHFMPQKDLLFFEIHAFDFIGKLENFEKDFSKLLIKLNIKPSDNLRSLIQNRINTKHVTLSENYLETYYTEKSIQLVQQIFKDDFDSFGYSFEFKEIN